MSEVPITEDWRYLNAEILRGLSFIRKPYQLYREGWDHDHCTGCYAKFMVEPGPDILTEGWAVDASHPQGADYAWVCPECYDLLKDVLDWTPR
jgi:hypothetical protein